MKALPKGHIDETPLAIKVLEALAAHLKREALPMGPFREALPVRHIEEVLPTRNLLETLAVQIRREALLARHIINRLDAELPSSHDISVKIGCFTS